MYVCIVSLARGLYLIFLYNIPASRIVPFPLLCDSLVCFSFYFPFPSRSLQDLRQISGGRPPGSLPSKVKENKGKTNRSGLAVPTRVSWSAPSITTKVSWPRVLSMFETRSPLNIKQAYVRTETLDVLCPIG